MDTKIIDGKVLANKLNEITRKLIEEYQLKPKLDIILASPDRASHKWVQRKQEVGKDLGIEVTVHELDNNCQTEDVVTAIKASQGGVLVQLPLYSHLDYPTILNAIPIANDVDGLRPEVTGLIASQQTGFIPATVLACMTAINAGLGNELFQIGMAIPELKGKHVVIINHSNLIGRPLAQMLLNHGATVTICHDQTANLRFHTLTADIIVTATGVIGLIDHSYIKQGAVVIDVTSKKNEGQDGYLGDVVVSSELIDKVHAYTPVPGGVGPLTIAWLMYNTALASHQLQNK